MLVRLARRKHARLKFRLVDAIREVLRLQTEPGVFAVHRAALSLLAVQEVARVQLHARRVALERVRDELSDELVPEKTPIRFDLVAKSERKIFRESNEPPSAATPVGPMRSLTGDDDAAAKHGGWLEGIASSLAFLAPSPATPLAPLPAEPSPTNTTSPSDSASTSTPTEEKALPPPLPPSLLLGGAVTVARSVHRATAAAHLAGAGKPRDRRCFDARMPSL